MQIYYAVEGNSTSGISGMWNKFMGVFSKSPVNTGSQSSSRSNLTESRPDMTVSSSVPNIKFSVEGDPKSWKLL